MVSPLTPTELRKLVGILGRLGSDFDGERAAAGLLASRLLRDRGITWDVLILGGAGTQEPGAWPPGGSDIALCIRLFPELTAWEAVFITDLRQKRRPLTPKQNAKVAQIAAALRARGLS